MPLYTYQCAQCGRVEDAMRRMSDRANGPACCGETMPQKIVAPMVQAQILGGGSCPGYKCVVTGEYVTSRKRRREIMAQHNLIEKGDSKPPLNRTKAPA